MERRTDVVVHLARARRVLLVVPLLGVLARDFLSGDWVACNKISVQCAVLRRGCFDKWKDIHKCRGWLRVYMTEPHVFNRCVLTVRLHQRADGAAQHDRGHAGLKGTARVAGV